MECYHRERIDGEFEAVVDPRTMLSVVDDPESDPIAAEGRERFDRVLDTLTASE